MNRIRLLREERNMLQTDLAKVIDVSQKTISNYENGTRDIPTETLKILASYFDVSTDYLLGISDIRKPLNLNKEDLEAGKAVNKFLSENKIDLSFEIEKLGLKTHDLYSLNDEAKNEIKSFVEFIKSKYGKEN